MRRRPPLTRVAVVLATAFLSAGAVGPGYGAAAAEVDGTTRIPGSDPVLLLSQLSEDPEDQAKDLEDQAKEAAEAAAEEVEELQEAAEKAAKDDEPKKQAKPDKPKQADEPLVPEETDAPVPAPVPDAEPQTNDPGKAGSPSVDPTQVEKPTPAPTSDVTPAGKPKPHTAPGTAAAPATAGSHGGSSGRGPATDAQSAGDPRAPSGQDLTGGPPATSSGPDTGATNRAPSSPRPLLECLEQTTSADCEEQVVAGLGGPGGWQDGGSASGQRSEAFELFDADPDLIARAQHRNGSLDGVAGSQAAWPEMGTGQLLLITIVPPLALLALSYVALGRRYP